MLTIAATIVLLGVLITVHEFGHFVVAKLSNVKVDVFSIGFGPPLVKIRRGETEYRIAQLPLGGYVRMAGQDPSDPSDSADVGRRLHDKPPWVRILIAAAGPAMNVILPFFILFPFYGLSDIFEQVASNEVGAVDRGLPAWAAGLREGDHIVEINGEPIHAFWQIAKHIDAYDDADGPLRMSVSREDDDEPIALVVRPERVEQTDSVLGFARDPYRIGYQPGFLAPDIAVTDSSGPLAHAGMQTFDRVTSANGEETPRYVDFLRALTQAKAGDLVELHIERAEPPLLDTVPFVRLRREHAIRVRAPADASTETAWGVRHAGACITTRDPTGPAAALQRGDCILAVNGEAHTLDAFLLISLMHEPETPKKLTVLRDGEPRDFEIALEKVVRHNPFAGEITHWRAGLTLLTRPDALVPMNRIKNETRAAHAWYRTNERVEGQIWMTVHSLAGLLTRRVSTDQLSGPLTIAYLAGRAAKAGLAQYLGLMVMISLGLALLNMLPIPVLDGGQILIAAIEMVIRRPVPLGIQMKLMHVGVVLVFALIVLAVSNDVVRMVRMRFG